MPAWIRLWLVMIALHAPAYFLWGWVLFRHWADFWDAIVSWSDFDSWSLDDDDEGFRYGVRDVAKLAVWFFAPIGLIALEIHLLGW